MLLLLLVSFVWAFSFGLIKGKLAGVDPTAVATVRLFLALLVFLPLLRARGLAGRVQWKLAAIGAVQFGAMYVLYLRSFAYLQAYEVALFTITTPLLIALLDSAAKRRLVVAHAAAAVLSVAGAAVILWQRPSVQSGITGVLLVQCSNLCFAAGQLAWRRVRRDLAPSVTDASVFGLVYAGAAAASLLWSFFTTDWLAFRLNWTQAGTLLYLGILASGLCFFWWNVGATRVNTGALAAVNNAKIPLAVACSLLFFHEHANLPRLLTGGVLMAAGVFVAQGRNATPRTPAASVPERVT